MDFNQVPSLVMHVDINSCFATIEQQADPRLRGIPIAVAAYDSPSGCILAASIEAKKYGIKTGMRVFEGKNLYPRLRVLKPDTDKYRFIHTALKRLLMEYSPSVMPKSIDEFVIDFSNHTILKTRSCTDIACEIKSRIRQEVGEWISVSVGIGPNRFLAKVAAGMKKPDGLIEITKDNFYEAYENLSLRDLHGINFRNEARLNSVGIYTTVQFYKSDLLTLRAAFHSINAFYWFLRLRGWEADGIEFGRKSFGNSYSIPQNYTTVRELSAILAKLVNKATGRMRKAGKAAHGVHVSTSFKGGGFWHHGERAREPIFYTSEIYYKALQILSKAPIKSPVLTLSVSCYDLVDLPHLQLALFEDRQKKKELAKTMDKINKHFGSFVLMTARMLSAGDAVGDRIGFGQTGLEI